MTTMKEWFDESALEVMKMNAKELYWDTNAIFIGYDRSAGVVTVTGKARWLNELTYYDQQISYHVKRSMLAKIGPTERSAIVEHIGNLYRAKTKYTGENIDKLMHDGYLFLAEAYSLGLHPTGFYNNDLIGMRVKSGERYTFTTDHEDGPGMSKWFLRMNGIIRHVNKIHDGSDRSNAVVNMMMKIITNYTGGLKIHGRDLYEGGCVRLRNLSDAELAFVTDIMAHTHNCNLSEPSAIIIKPPDNDQAFILVSFILKEYSERVVRDNRCDLATMRELRENFDQTVACYKTKPDNVRELVRTDIAEIDHGDGDDSSLLGHFLHWIDRDLSWLD